MWKFNDLIMEDGEKLPTDGEEDEDAWKWEDMDSCDVGKHPKCTTAFFIV